MRTILSSLTSAICFFAAFAPVSGQESPSGERLKNLTPDGFYIGGAVHSFDPGFENKIDYQATALDEFNAITISAYMPFGTWIDQDAGPDLAGWNDRMDWAVANNFKIHGHTLLFPNANESLDWYQELPVDEVEPVLFQYIDAIVRERAGEVWVWDVVNEVLSDTDNPADADGLRMNRKAYEAMGPTYVNKAFEWAKAADPDALLILNEYSAEEVNEKSTRLLRYMKKLRRVGVPVDGVGFQMHFLDTQNEPNYASIAKNFRRFATAGFRIFITELDVASTLSDSPDTRPTNAERLRQRRIYRKIMKLAIEQPAVNALFLWDFADNESWLHPVRSDLVFAQVDDYTFPTPFWGGVADPLIAKPAYYGLQQSLVDVERPEPIDPLEPVDPLELADKYRIKSALAPTTGYLERTTVEGAPGFETQLAELTAENSNSLSFQWTFENAAPGVYRIRSRYGNRGYLTRIQSDGEYTNSLSLTPSTNDVGQLWNVEWLSINRYRIRSNVPIGSDSLTRLSDSDPASESPSSVVGLAPFGNSTSQVWKFQSLE